MAAPIELYFWPTPNGHKITIALEEMELKYELRPVNISAGEQFAPDFLKISPNNRMPAIIDPDGPGGRAISVFESGAILQYLGRKSGKFYPPDERKRVAVEEWLMWQMANLGPMSGQAGHFLLYAPRIVADASKLEYGQKRYRDEVNRLYGVLDRRLQGRPYLADDYSIADMAAWPWARSTRAGLGEAAFDPFPNVQEWLQRIEARPAVARALAAGAELSRPLTQMSQEEIERASRIIFGQTAQSVAAAAKARAP
jgi:glutathione S-transferase